MFMPVSSVENESCILCWVIFLLCLLRFLLSRPISIPPGKRRLCISSFKHPPTLVCVCWLFGEELRTKLRKPFISGTRLHSMWLGLIGGINTSFPLCAGMLDVWKDHRALAVRQRGTDFNDWFGLRRVALKGEYCEHKDPFKSTLTFREFDHSTIWFYIYTTNSWSWCFK